MAAVFVHLSDIHFGQEKLGGERAPNDDARRQLIEDAARLIASLPNEKASGIIVTGDIAYAGKRDQYDAAGSWLDELARRIDCNAADIQMVPGNHDIDRDSIKGASAWMLDAIHEEGEATLDRFLDDDMDREVLYHRFKEYRRFADAYQCSLDCNGNNSAERRVELAVGRAIRFVRLNSALICSKNKKEYGKLLLGARQRIMSANPGEELVVLAHHPLSWYADSAEAKKFLHGRARVFISGHEHLAAVDVQNIEEGSDLMMLAAGATTPDEVVGKFTYAYNILQFDWDEEADALAVTLYPRVWNDDMKRFERDADRQESVNGRKVLGSPNFRKAARPPALSVDAETETETLAPVEIILSKDEVTASQGLVDETEYQNLYLRFFRDLAEGARLRILVELDAVPSEIAGGFTHATESKLFRSVVRANRFNELREKVETALAAHQ